MANDCVLTVLCTTAVLQSQTVAQAGQDMSRIGNYYVFKRKEEKNMNLTTKQLHVWLTPTTSYTYFANLPCGEV